MAKKAAARKSAKKRTAKKSRRRAAGMRAAEGSGLVRLEFKPLHDAIDATLARVKARKPSIQREKLILKLTLMQKLRLCPKNGMFAFLK